MNIYRFKGPCITLVVSLIFLWLIACSDKSAKVISSEVSQSGKPTAPISISYTVPEKTTVGENVTVIVEFRTLSDAEGLRIEFTAGEGLKLTSGRYKVDYGIRPGNSTFSETVTVVPQTEGILYLNVFVTGIFGGNTMVRTGAVPVNVGATTHKMLKKPGNVTTDSKGQKIMILPAEEKKLSE